VYLGVGPEQNFTYIANLKPRLAVIIDVRRQNAMLHLMYKALFELSTSRAEFVSRLFSRPLPSWLRTETATEIFDAVAGASPSDSAFQANWTAIIDRLVVAHGFALSEADRASIRHVYSAFFEAGSEINYGYRPGARLGVGWANPTFAQLQVATNASGVNMAFLASDANYEVLRTMHLNNLIVPVVGNFAGPKAIRVIGQYLKQRNATVTAFYVSNVEQYLFRPLDYVERFYTNVADLPIDSTSTFIRSFPPSGDRHYTLIPSNPALTVSKDSVTRGRQDSSGRAPGVVNPPTSILRTDSAGLAMLSKPVFVSSSMLISGIVRIRATLEAFKKGELSTFAQAIAMTKIDGWE
jgi:hypothetical protein